MGVALATGWTPEQVWSMRPADLATVVDMLDRDQEDEEEDDDA